LSTSISEDSIVYRVSPPVTDGDLNALFAAAWEGHETRSFAPVLERSLAYVCAFAGGRLAGFVNLAWDGGCHAFVLDTTVHPDFRRRGIGVAMVERAAEVARERGVEWLHVDYEPRLEEFYRRCGFRHTAAGVRRLDSRR
jgi:GNAT superfamily N-acetyltransferase